METELTITIIGRPAPAGSYRPVPIPGGGSRIIDTNKRTKPWQALVQAAAMDEVYLHGFELIQGPVVVHSCFYFVRPRCHYRTGKHSGLLRPDAPNWHCQTPDVSKLARAIEDALTGVVYRDDCLIVKHDARKLWDRDKSWCEIVVRRPE